MVIVLSVGFDTAAATEPVRLLIERGAQAILFVGRIDAPALIDFLRRRNVPVVTTYSHVPDGAFPSIGFDNADAMRQVMAHLLHLGHREFMLLSGPRTNNDRQMARVGAFDDVLAAAGIDPAGRVIECVYSLSRGAEALRAIRCERPETTCVVCSSDILAAGVLAECRRLGIAVPDALSVTGFDDLDFASITDPPLTTIAVPAVDMGRTAAESLLRALGGDRTIGPVLLESRLVLRASTGRPRMLQQERCSF
jgi:LacI family transcriptional regulator